MSHCENCFKGVTHDGTPEGRIEKLGGIECYIATPTGDYAKDKAVLFLTDVFGIALKNSRLLADDFARNGFLSILPDMFNGDPYPANYLDKTPPSVPFDREAWFSKHGPEQTRPIVDAVVAALKEKEWGVTRIAATGYCYGARFVFDLAFAGASHVSAISHPGRLTVPDDLEIYLSIATAPLLVNSCEVDRAFPLEAQAKADEIFGEGKFAPGYRREYFAGCEHGFAVRGDMSDPKVKEGKEGAFKACVEWFGKYL